MQNTHGDIFTTKCPRPKKLRTLTNKLDKFQLLLNLSLENNTDLGKFAAAQTLAKIAITQDPKITFSGQRVRPSLYQTD